MMDPLQERNLDAPALEAAARSARARAGRLALAFLGLCAFSLGAQAYVASFGPSGMLDGRYTLVERLYVYGDMVSLDLPLLLLLGATLVVPFTVGLAFYGARALRGARLAFAAVYLVGTAALFSVHAPVAAVRRHGFAHAAEEMRPLVAALDAYRADHGAAPDRLERLVPAYLPSVAGFGVRGCRALEYEARGERYELSMECPKGWATLDRFSHPFDERHADSPRYVRVGDWAYFMD